MILEDIFLVTGILGLIMGILISFGANIYDIKETKKHSQIAAHPHSRQFTKRPLISVIVSTHNDQSTIGLCLRSLFKSSYRKFEVIVVDNNSSDKTKSMVKKLISEYPNRTIRLVARRSDKGKGALLSVYKKHGQGELVMLLDATSTIDKRALSNAVRHFNVDQTIGLLSFKRDTLFAFSTVGLFQKYENLLQYRSKKFASVSNSDYLFNVADSVYRRDVFMSVAKTTQTVGVGTLTSPIAQLKLGNIKARPYYANDAVVYNAQMSSFSRLLRQRYRLQRNRTHALRLQRKLVFKNSSDYSKFLTLFRLPLAMCVGIAALFIPVLLSYFVYLAVELREPTLLILSWLILGILLLIAIWGDDHLKLGRKLIFSLFVPITYGAFYLMSFIQLFAVLRGLTYPLAASSSPRNS